MTGHNVTASAMDENTSGQVLTVVWVQPGGGGVSYVWPSNFVFAGGVAPVASTAPNARDSLTFYCDGTNFYEIARSPGSAIARATLPAGTSSAAPQYFQSGTNLTAAAAGAHEYDGVAAYFTNETTSGRGLIPVEQKFRLTATGGTISTIANYFGTNSNISLVSGGEYEIEIDCWFLCTTGGAVTWTFTNSAAPTAMNIAYQFSPATGLVTGANPPTATALFGEQYDLTTAAPTVVSATLTTAVNHHHHFWIRLINGTGTSLKIQATKGTGGTITPGINSSWKARRVPAANVGLVRVHDRPLRILRLPGAPAPAPASPRLLRHLPGDLLHATSPAAASGGRSGGHAGHDPRNG